MSHVRININTVMLVLEKVANLRDPRETEDGRQGIIAHPQPNLVKVKVGLG